MRIRSVIPSMRYSRYKDQNRLSNNSVKWREHVDTKGTVSFLHQASALERKINKELGIPFISQDLERKSSVVVILENNLNGRTKCYKTSSFPLTNGSTTSSTTISNEAELCQFQEKSFLTGDPHSN